MINDYYSVSYLPIDTDGFIEELNIISRFYRSHGINRIFMSLTYDPVVTVSAYLSRSSAYFANARRSLCTNVKLVPIHTVTLFEGLSEISDLYRLALKSGTSSFLYINIPLGISRDVLATELHHIIYKHKLTPVFTRIESVAQFSEKQVFDTLLSVPNATHLFSLPYITNRDSAKLIRRLIADGKNVIFGSADGFDACPYKNVDFYKKHLIRAIGKENFGYYMIRHNRFFK